MNIHHSEQAPSSQHSSKKRISQKKSVDDKERVRKEEVVEKRREDGVRQEEIQHKQFFPTFLDNTEIQAIPTVDDSLILPNPPSSTHSVFYLL